MGDRCFLNMWLIKLAILLVQPGIIPCLRAQWQPSCASLELLITTPHPFQQDFPNVSSFPEKNIILLISKMSWLSWVGLKKTVTSFRPDAWSSLACLCVYLCLSFFCTHWLTHPHSCQNPAALPATLSQKISCERPSAATCKWPNPSNPNWSHKQSFHLSCCCSCMKSALGWSQGCSRSIIPS